MCVFYFQAHKLSGAIQASLATAAAAGEEETDLFLLGGLGAEAHDQVHRVNPI